MSVIESSRERHEGPDADDAALPPAVADRIAAVLDAVADGVTVQDASGRVVYANATAVRLIGFDSPAELLGATPDEILSRFEIFDEAGIRMPASALPGRRALLGVVEPSVTLRFRVVASGVERWSVVTAIPLADDDGRVLFAINTFHDITERVRAETAVRAGEARYRQLVEAMPQIAWVTDAGGRAVLVNRRWIEYTGVPLEAVTALDFDAWVHPDDLAVLRARRRVSIDRGMPLDALVRLRRADGAYRWHLVRAVPQRGEHGIEGWISTSTDIDDARRAEDSVRLLARASARLDEPLELDETLAAVTAVAVPELADWCIVDLVEPDGSTRRAAIVSHEPALAEIVDALRALPTDPARGGLGSVALRTARPALIADVGPRDLARIARNETHLDLLTRLDPRSLMALPLVARGETVGVLLLASQRSGRRYSPADLDLANELAARAALAIANAKLFENEARARKAAEAAVLRTARLQRVAGALAGAFSRVEVVETVLADAAKAVGAVGGTVVLRSGDGHEAEVAAASGLRQEYLDAWRRFPLDTELPLAEAVRSGRAVWLDRVSAATSSEPRLEQALRTSPFASLCAVPILIEGRAVGALGLVYAEPRPFDEDERAYITAFADLAAQAIDRVTLQEAREDLLASVEEQRVRLETVLREMPFGVLMAEAPSGRLLLVNEAVGAIWRRELPRFETVAAYAELGAFRPDLSRYEPDECPLARAVLRGEKIRDEELAIERGDGTRGWIVANASPIRDRDGSVVAGVMTVVDVSERRRRQENQRFLAEAGEVLAASVDVAETVAALARLAVPRVADWCAIDLIDEDGDLRRAATAHADPAKLAIAHDLEARYPMDGDAPRGPASVARSGRSALVADLAADAIAAHTVDEPHAAALAALGLRSYMCVPLVAGDRTLGAITFVTAESGRRYTEDDVAFAENVASRAAAAIERARLSHARLDAAARLERLAAAEHARAAELNAVIRAMGEAVVASAADGGIVVANPAARALFGPAVDASWAAIRACFDEPDAVPELGRRAGPIELRLAGDTERWVEVSAYPVEHEDGAADASGGERRSAAECAGPDGERETIVLVRDVTDARQRQAVRDTFLGVLSHELRTPITTIYAAAKVLSRPSRTLSEELRAEIFDDVRLEAERLHRLVEDVLAMTRFGEEQGEVGNEPVLVQRILPTVVRSEQARWPGVAFRLDVPTGLPTVVADPTYVEQVVRNLLSNAAKYGGSSAAVDVIGRAAGDEVVVRILDDGPGFPPEEAERLFELFFRSPTTAGSTGGAGIGLFVCARLIRAMGGRIWARPRHEGGAEFGFSLRVMDEDAV